MSADQLRDSAQAMLDHYLRLANSGDAGNWDPETEPVVIAVRAAIRQAGEAPFEWLLRELMAKGEARLSAGVNELLTDRNHAWRLLHETDRAAFAQSTIFEALKRIERWFDEFPETGKFWDAERTQPMSYAAVFGSNGERDFMRGIASEALAAFRQQAEAPAQARECCKTMPHGLPSYPACNGCPNMTPQVAAQAPAVPAEGRVQYVTQATRSQKLAAAGFTPRQKTLGDQLYGGPREEIEAAPAPVDAGRERKTFEEIMRRETFDTMERVSDGTYRSYEARVGWIMWQARAALPPAEPAPAAEAVAPFGHLIDCHEGTGLRPLWRVFQQEDELQPPDKFTRIAVYTHPAPSAQQVEPLTEAETKKLLRLCADLEKNLKGYS